MGLAGDRRRRRRRTFALAAGLGVLLSLVAVGGADPSPPPPLPALPSARDDLALRVRAERDGGGLRVDVALTVDRPGRPLTVRAWDGDTVVGERLARGQVVLHLGLVSAGADVPDEIYTYAMPQPPPPVMVLPGRTLEAGARFDGSGPELDGFAPADRDDVRRLEEVRVCVWSRDEAASGGDDPAICADDRL